LAAEKKRKERGYGGNEKKKKNRIYKGKNGLQKQSPKMAKLFVGRKKKDNLGKKGEKSIRRPEQRCGVKGVMGKNLPQVRGRDSWEKKKTFKASSGNYQRNVRNHEQATAGRGGTEDKMSKGVGTRASKGEQPAAARESKIAAEEVDENIYERGQ